MFNRHLKKFIKLFFIISLLTTSSFCLATVTMVGNRIIYPANAKEKMLQFSNPDNIPYMIQIWTDINNPKSKPDTADGPFITAPHLFRIEPNQGQIVRLMFNNKMALPTDKESLFYFNFLQFPGLDTSQKEQNKIVLLVTSRLKIFYRPNNLNITPEEISNKIKFKVKNNQLEVTNDSPYHATFGKVTFLDANNKTIAEIKEPLMVAPFSKDTWNCKTKLIKTKVINYTLINDFGVSIQYQFSL
ncbi:molecular chaperone [Orbaceae bacterium ac157xtp]